MERAPSGLVAFEVVSRIHKLPVDMRAAIRQYAIIDEWVPPEVLVRIAKNSGFKAKLKRTLSVAKLAEHYPLPAIGLLPDNIYMVLLKVNEAEHKALCFNAITQQTEELTYAELPTDWIVLSPKVFNSETRFGFEWFYREILTYKMVIAEVLTGSFIVQLFGLVTPLLTQVILDKVIVHHSLTTLDVLAVAFAGITLFELLLNLARNYIFTHTANKVDAKLGAKLFRQLFALPYVYFESRKVGTIIACIRELENIREFITNKSVSVIIDLFFSFVFVAMMLLYSVKLTLVVLGFVTLITVIYLLVTPQFRARLQVKFQMAASSNAYLVEAVTGVQTVKSLAIEGMMQKKWEDRLGEYLGASFKLSNMSNIAGATATLFQRLMTISILYFGVRLVIQNQMSVGQLIAFNMLSGQFTGPVLRLVNLWNEFQQALLGVDRLGDILNQPTEIQSSQMITLPQLQGDIRFENIKFRYTVNGPHVLDDISFHVEPGTTIGLVGRSGSGKSTITKLVQRLYFANEGAIYIDGIDVRQMNPVWLRYQIGVVLQDNYLFSGTIRENIAMPRPDAPIELVIQAAKLAGAHEFITELPEGYETVVGERGSTLSGGQRQRVAIARALITNPRILILDEATSALDADSERIINRNMQAIRQGRTVLIISHRLSSIACCERIIAMDGGKIVEMGTREELMAKKGYFHHLATEEKEEAFDLHGA